MPRRETFWSRAATVGGCLAVSAVIDRGRGEATLVHVSVAADGALAASSILMRMPPDPARAADAIMSGRNPDGSPAPGPLPTNVPGNPSPEWRGAAFGDVARILRGDAGAMAMEALRERLDPAALDVAMRAPNPYCLTSAEFNALNATPGAALDVRDVLDRHPWILRDASLAEIVRDRTAWQWPKASPDERVREIAERLWHKRHHYGEIWPLKAAAIRRMAGLEQPDAPGFMQMGFLSALPPEWIPAHGSSQWSMCMAVAEIAGSRWCRRPEDLPALLAGCRGDFVALAERIRPPAAGDDARFARQEVETLLRVSVDALECFERDVLGPALALANERAGQRETAAIAREMLGVSGIASIAEVSRRWHAHERAIRLAVTPLDKRTWPAATKPFRTRSGVDVVALTSAAALDDEGAHGFDVDGVEGMGHCVGSRAGACSQGHTHILSVRRSSGRAFRRLSTVEVTFERDGPRVREHRGRGNVQPPREAVAAVAEWVDAIASGKLKTNPEALARRTPRDSPKAEALERAVAAWSGLLKRRYRNLDATDAALAVLDLLDAARRPAPERRNAAKPERRDAGGEASPSMRR